MAISLAVLIDSKYAETTTTNEYTTPDGTQTVIDKVTALNESANDALLHANIVKSGDESDNSNAIIDNRFLANGETYLCPELTGHVLNAGDSIYFHADTADAVVVRVSGHQIT
jgi:hypothetical protein